MRYAFYMYDFKAKQNYVAKLPMNLDPLSYNLDSMKNDIEA